MQLKLSSDISRFTISLDFMTDSCYSVLTKYYEIVEAFMRRIGLVLKREDQEAIRSEKRSRILCRNPEKKCCWNPRSRIGRQVGR